MGVCAPAYVYVHGDAEQAAVTPRTVSTTAPLESELTPAAAREKLQRVARHVLGGA